MNTGFDDHYFSSVRLTLTDVKRMQRWAWRPASSGEYPTHFYDGINFWWQPRPYERVMVPDAVAPSDGWRHRATCNCAICRGAGSEPRAAVRPSTPD